MAIERIARGRACVGALIALPTLLGAGCASPPAGRDNPAGEEPEPPAPATQPAVRYDTTLARPRPARDWLEAIVYDRGIDFQLIDWLMDERTTPPPLGRVPLPRRPAGAEIAPGVALLDDRDPFPEPAPLWPREVSIHVGLARSTFKTREREEVLSAAQPFIELTQRQVNVRGAPVLHETPDELFYYMLEGREQMAVAHVFDYLLIRSWFADQKDNATILLGWAQPARPRVTELDRDLPGVPGTCIELVVAGDSPYQSFADLRGRRLAVAANDTRGPGTFLTRLLADAGQPPDQPYFGSVTLRRYAKDALIDVLKGKADAACVDQGTVGALDRFYGLGTRLRTIAISPRYNMDVLFSSLNNLATHRTEIELTQQQLNTLGKDPEGQEVLFFFDVESWRFYREGDIDVPRQHFPDFVRFLSQTPVDLRPLLDPQAPVDRRTYDRLGDE
jgi:hypothetical protein